MVLSSCAVNGLQLENYPRWISTENISTTLSQVSGLHPEMHTRNRMKSTVRASVRRWRSPCRVTQWQSYVCVCVKSVSGFRAADVPGLGAGWEGSSSTGTLFLTAAAAGVNETRLKSVRKFGCGGNFNWIMHSKAEGSTFVCAFSTLRAVNGRGLEQISSAWRGHLSLDLCGYCKQGLVEISGVLQKVEFANVPCNISKNAIKIVSGIRSLKPIFFSNWN